MATENEILDLAKEDLLTLLTRADTATRENNIEALRAINTEILGRYPFNQLIASLDALRASVEQLHKELLDHTHDHGKVYTRGK